MPSGACRALWQPSAWRGFSIRWGPCWRGGFPGRLLGKTLAFIAGDFIYIGASDMLPEAHRKFNWKVVVSVVGGMAFMWVLRLFAPHVCRPDRGPNGTGLATEVP